METYRLIGDVRLGKDVVIDDFVIIGIVPAGADADVSTSIGEKSHIRSHSTIYAGNVTGSGFNTGHGVRIREYNRIGDNVSIGTNSVVEHHVKIEDGVRIHSQAFIPEYSILKKGAWIGPNVVLTNARYPLYPGVKDHLEGVIIEEGAKIGANSTILPGIRVGKNAVVGAGSVVTKDVKDNTVVAGNPAVFLKYADDLGYEEES